MQIKNLNMSFNNQELFKEVNLHINELEKVGIIGSNGAGKTTFFKIILGEITPDQGKVIVKDNLKIGYLPQIISSEVPSLNISVLDFLLLGRPITSLTTKLEQIYLDISTTNDPQKQKELFKKADSVQKELDYYEPLSAENTLLKIISGMNIPSELLDQSLNTLSGGQKSKVAFAKLLYSKSELILLDEPTNHLDEETKEYVTKYLKKYQGSVYLISHDIAFLDSITTKILFIDKRTQNFKLYSGNYSDFIRLNLEHDKFIENQIKIEEREEKKLRKIINEYTNSSGNRKKMAQDREKKLANLLSNKIEPPKSLEKTKVKLNINQESTNIPLKVDHISFKYVKESNSYIIHNLAFSLTKGEKFLIVGENGIGKSTLLKLIVGSLTPDQGYIELGPKTEIGYYAQEHELLNDDQTIIDNFQDLHLELKVLRSTLGQFLFHGNDIYKKVKILSPGEKSRVALAKLSLVGANLLILDEPTNHIDPETQKIIAQAFKTYPGTMLVVSHNLSFINNLGIERTLSLPSGQIAYYDQNVIKQINMSNKHHNH